MAMCRPYYFVAIRHSRNQFAHSLAPRCRNRITNGIRHVNRCGTSLNHCIKYADQKAHFRTNSIFSRKFHIMCIFQRPLYCLNRPFNHLVFRHAKFVFHVDFTGSNKRMNTPVLFLMLHCRFNRLTCTAHIIFTGTCK